MTPVETKHIYNQSYYEKHKDEPDYRLKVAARTRKWYQEHKSDPDRRKRINATAKVFRAKHRLDPVYIEKDRSKGRRRYERKRQDPLWMKRKREEALARYYRYRSQPETAERVRQNRHTCYERARELVFNVYGRVCACCGESNPKFLTVDHINNDGAEHRAQLTGGIRRKQGTTGSYLRKIAKLADPTRFQILCYNCNCGKAHNGGICPHKGGTP